MKLDPEEIKKLARMTLGSKPADVSCEDWIHMLGEYVEAAQSGGDLTTERMRIVWQHAQDCPPCMDELEALRPVVERESAGEERDG